jgi:hypothetical protein
MVRVQIRVRRYQSVGHLGQGGFFRGLVAMDVSERKAAHCQARKLLSYSHSIVN